MEYKEKKAKALKNKDVILNPETGDVIDKLSESLNGEEDLPADINEGVETEKSVVHVELMSQNVFRNFWMKYTHHLNEKWEEKNAVEKVLYVVEYPFHLLM